MMRHQTPRTNDGKHFPVASCIVKGAAAASMAGLVFAASPAHCDLSAGPFAQQFGANNPLKAPVDVSMYEYARPVFVDIDNDGDFDMFVGGEGLYSGNPEILFFENTGTNANPGFVERTGPGPDGNPFYGMDVGDGPAPAFVDIDDDGDMDAFVGRGNGYFDFFENTGTASAPAFTPYYSSNPENPLGDYVGQSPSIAFADLDGDGDMDALAGEGNGTLHYFKNEGTASAPEFTQYGPWNSDNPFYNVNVGYDSTPAFADLDGDGDMDTVVGNRYGDFHYFQNTGTKTAPAFTRYYPSETENPFYGQFPGDYSSPAFVDLDGDGDMDLVAGSYGGYGSFGVPTTKAAVMDFAGWQLNYFENVGAADAPAFAQRTGAKSPFTGFDVGYFSTPAFVDIDGDGDLDAFSGKLGALEGMLRPKGSEFSSLPVKGGIDFFENIGTASAPAFVDRSDNAENPFFELDPGKYSFVAFVDIDGDGDMDAFVGGVPDDDFFDDDDDDFLPPGSYATTFLRFFENTGTAALPVMSLRPDADNPLAAVNSDTNTVPRAIAFVDIDGDGDLDAFVGRKYVGGEDDLLQKTLPEGSVGGQSTPIQFYRNNGTTQNPVFTLDDNDNPLGFVLENTPNGGVYSLAFTDIDGDGDMDVVVGEYTGSEDLRRAKIPAPVVDDDDDDTDSSIKYYENVGSATAPAFAPVPKANDLFARMTGNSPYTVLSPAFVDIDADGDTDIFAGEAMGRFLFIENQTPPDEDDDAPVMRPVKDDDTCFVQAARADSQSSFVVRTARRFYDAATSIFR